MGGKISRHWQVVTATLFSVTLVFGAYILARGFESPPAVQASTETALLQAIATKDSSGDGLPDWEKALYGIPVNATTTDYFHIGMTDGEAVTKGLIVPIAIADIPVATSSASSFVVDPSLPPASAKGTLTAIFAQNFFTLYLAAKQANGGADLSANQTSAIANQAINSFAESFKPTPDFKSTQDLTVSGSGPAALKAFAVSAEAVFKQNTSTATTSELQYLQYAAQGNDTNALTQLTAIAKGYRESAVGLSVLPVPTELAADDLILINQMMRISEIITDFTKVNTDVLATILALEQYPQAVLSLADAFTHVGAVYATAGVTLPVGAPGASFVNLISDMAAKQKATAGKL